MRSAIALRARRLVGFVAVAALVALLLGDAARNHAAEVAHETGRFVGWCVAHWGCPQPLGDGTTVPCRFAGVGAGG